MFELIDYAYILNQLPKQKFYRGSRIDHPIINKGKVYNFLIYIYIDIYLRLCPQIMHFFIEENELSILI